MYLVVTVICPNCNSEVSESLLCSAMANLYYFSILKLLWRPIFPKSKANEMTLMLHTLLTEWCDSCSQNSAEHLLLEL